MNSYVGMTMVKSKHICADASVGIAYASLHAGLDLQSNS